jgi:glycosyltransferase involved in cell wall biosynthesis
MILDRTVTLVIPAHNEQEGLPCVLRAVPDCVDEVVVVDNCSTDNTAQVARGFGCTVVYQPEKGYGSAYMAGFAAVRTDLVTTADADGTYPVNLIPDLARVLLSDDLHFISARRRPDDHAGTLNSTLRFAGNFVLSAATIVLFQRTILDSQSGMWVFRRDILDSINLTSRGMALSEEFKIKAWTAPGLRCREVNIPFSYSERMGKPKLNLWRDGVRNLLFLFALRFGIPMTRA